MVYEGRIFINDKSVKVFGIGLLPDGLQNKGGIITAGKGDTHYDVFTKPLLNCDSIAYAQDIVFPDFSNICLYLDIPKIAGDLEELADINGKSRENVLLIKQENPFAAVYSRFDIIPIDDFQGIVYSHPARGARIQREKSLDKILDQEDLWSLYY